jgi:hypothetical protein
VPQIVVLEQLYLTSPEIMSDLKSIDLSFSP